MISHTGHSVKTLQRSSAPERMFEPRKRQRDEMVKDNRLPHVATGQVHQSNKSTFAICKNILEDIEDDDNFHVSWQEAYSSGEPDGYYVHVGGETRHADDLQEVACIIADYFEIPLGNYGVPLNRWYVVSRDFFIYLGEHGERVIDWNGMYIWGTWLRSENTYPIELDMVQEYYAYILNSNY